jgi:hypothetical protein
VGVSSHLLGTRRNSLSPTVFSRLAIVRETAACETYKCAAASVNKSSPQLS